MAKRAFDLFFAAVGLLVLGPALLLIALIVKLSDGGPVFFLQRRVGQGGRLFWVLKFRSMVTNAERLGLSVTADGDHRITRVGRFLRKHKWDELPQLWNVLRGEMSFVGPRPEVPRYVEKYTAEQKQILSLKPGITDLATLEFRDEEALLRRYARGRCVGAPEAGWTEVGVEAVYLEYCLPRKIQLSLAYSARANVWTDMLIILRTLFPFREAKRRAEHGGRKADEGGRSGGAPLDAGPLDAERFDGLAD